MLSSRYLNQLRALEVSLLKGVYCFPNVFDRVVYKFSHKRVIKKHVWHSNLLSCSYNYWCVSTKIPDDFFWSVLTFDSTSNAVARALDFGAKFQVVEIRILRETEGLLTVQKIPLIPELCAIKQVIQTYLYSNSYWLSICQ